MVSNNKALAKVISVGRLNLEEGIVRSRGREEISGLTEELGAAEVNGPVGAKGTWIWTGTYVVELTRGLTIDGVYHVSAFGYAAQNQRCIPPGEKVTITWLNRNNVQIPVIMDGVTLDFYNKMLLSNGHLLDPGEQIVRGAMAGSPGAEGKHPFANNQFDNPETEPNKAVVGAYDENIDKVVRLPAGETFYDKFGRVVSLSRVPDNEFITTNGEIDSGQDDVSDLTTVADQDKYYAKIVNDESVPVNPEEPFAPKQINLSQYQQTIKNLAVVGDPDPNRTVKRGILPRFDKWVFKPIIIRKYSADSDGVEEPETRCSRQDRSQTRVSGENPEYGYVRTATDKGDIKEFIPRHINQRVVGDRLRSIGGNDELKIKTTDRLANGNPNPSNLVHREYLADGTVRMRVNENVDDGTATYDKKVSPDGTVETYIKEGGGNSSDYNLKIKCNPDGSYEIESKAGITVNGVEVTVTATGTVDVLGSQINLGDNPTKQLCANLPNCLFTGAPLAVGNTKVRC